MADYQDILLRLSKRLYPLGRAWKMPFGGFFEKLHKALAKSENRAILAANSILDSTLPDNDNFDETDAANWERCLGIYSAVGTSLEDRKAAIRTHLNHPGTVAARQTREYIESVLQSAGFNVAVTENRFLEGSPPEYITKSPSEVYGDNIGEATLGNFSLGETNLGSQWSDDGVTIVANHIEEELDASFGFGDNLRSTFYISEPFVAGMASFVDVPAVRKAEFRQLILKYKPQQTVAILFVNYTT